MLAFFVWIFYLLTYPSLNDAVKQSLETISIPIYLGCYELELEDSKAKYLISSTDSIETSIPETFNFVTNTKLTPEACLKQCELLMASNNEKYNLALIKGSLCGCSILKDRKVFGLNPLRKVSNFNCNIPCPNHDMEEEHSNPIDPNKTSIHFTCGGNSPYSAYSIDVKDSESQIENNKTLKTPKYELERHLDKVYRNILTLGENEFQFPQLIPYISCAKCETCSFPSRGTPGFAYAPLNSPFRCINYCKRYLTTLQQVGDAGERITSPNTLAVLTFSNGLPSCYCLNSLNPEISLSQFEPVETTKCNLPCPGESSSKCGGLDENGCNYVVLFNMTYVRNNKSTTVTPEIITADHTTENSTKGQPPFKFTSIPTTIENANNSTILITEPLMVTEAGAHVEESETSTEGAPAFYGCKRKCEQTDREGFHWSSCPGLAECKCKGVGNTGKMTWYCSIQGKFIGHPNYKNCSTGWISHIRKKIPENGSLNFTTAFKVFKYMNKKVECGKNASDWDSKYYGHEMIEILHLTDTITRLIDKNETSLISYENLTDISMSIYDQVFRNGDLWLQLSRSECTRVGTDFITQYEHRLLGLSSLVAGDDSIQEPYSRNYKNEYCQQTVGTKSIVEGGSLDKFIFPADANLQKDSFIELPSNWVNYVINDRIRNDDDVEFVGVEMEPVIANYLFPADDRVYSTNASYGDLLESEIEIIEDKIVNGNIMSFTFGKDTESTSINFTGSGVKITFIHNVTAWGTESHQVRRKLHEGEARKAVKGSAKCVFWIPETMSWATDGCFLVETSREKTICECYHLTAFALVMDLHNYVGRDFALEILTWILCPTSIICLFLTIITLAWLKPINNSPRSIITRHLSTCLLIAMILMLTLMDKNYILPGNILCSLTAIAIHYFLLSAFIWMCCEGILLYRMIVLVFETGRNYIKYQIISAYGIPLIIVGITIGLSELGGGIENAYGGDEFCWLEDNYIWAFLGPISAILIFNIIILIISFKTAYSLSINKPYSHKGDGQRKKTKFFTLLRGSFSISVLLGVTWIFGYLMLINNYTVSNVAAYVFTILNASQGILLFCFHCLWNNKVREALNSHFPYLRQFDLHSTSNSNSNEKLHISNSPCTSECGSIVKSK